MEHGKTFNNFLSGGKLTHGSLFSGIGGFDLAAEWMGWENIFHCEINEFSKKILNYHFPKSIDYDDIKKTDFSIHRGTIDVLTGGFPCQPYSLTGKRKGKDDERHLWPEMLRAIREIQPKWIVGENVFGIINWNGGLVFNEVQSELENEGYKIQPYILPAGGKNAPHKRDRVWFIANSNMCGQLGNKEWEKRFKFRKWREAFCKFNGISSERDVMHTNSTSEQGKYFCQTRKGKSYRPNSRNEFDRFTNFPIKPPICGTDDGIPRELDSITFSNWRTESVKSIGNAIVPQVAYEIFLVIEFISSLKRREEKLLKVLNEPLI